jgi:hypothetical protein
MNDRDYIERLLDLSVEFMSTVNEVLANVEVPDGLMPRLAAAREALARELAEGDAGVHRVIWSRLWRGCYVDQDDALRGPDGALHDKSSDYDWPPPTPRR